MLVTDRTREALRCRRIRRKLTADGFEEIGENGGHLWELHRDIKRNHNTITAVAIAPEGMMLFVRVEQKDKPPRSEAIPRLVERGFAADLAEAAKPRSTGRAVKLVKTAVKLVKT